MEKQVLMNANAIDTVSWHWADDFEKLCGRKIEVVTNGFDEEDFELKSEVGSRKSEVKESNKFVIAHIGSLNKDRNHPALWEALKELCDEQKDFREQLVIQLIGKNDFSVYQLIEQNSLLQSLQRIDYVPHNEVGVYQRRASVLYLPINNTPNSLGVVPGKLFEYLAARRPILIIGAEEGDSARIVREANAGVVCGITDKVKINTEIAKMFMLWKNGDLKADTKGVEQYSRKKIAGKIAAILNNITG
jgi:glycosyltransferase involved in cell wall biosynthesis